MNDEILRSLVTRLTVRTAWTPAVVVNDPFGPSTASGNAAAVFMRPALDVEMPGGRVKTFAPWGDPGAGNWPVVQTGVILGVAALVALILGRR